MVKPLRGVKVVELATWAALPGGAAILADWGADVVKIEDPRTGDPLRGFHHAVSPGESNAPPPAFEQKNRNKRNIALDVSLPEGREVIRALLDKADVFVTSMRPATLARYHLTHAELSESNPGLVMVHLSGFGHKGPDSHRPGYDALCFWSRTGLARSLAGMENDPISQRPAQGDLTTSIAIAGGVCAALFERSQTGKGQEVLASLYGTGLWIVSSDITTSFVTGENPRKLARKDVGNPLVTTYRTKDSWVHLVNLQSERFWPPLCRAVGREDLIEDERFKDPVSRAENGPALIEIFDAEFEKRTVDEWQPRLDAEGIRWGRVPTTLDATQDEQAWVNGYYQTIPHPDRGEMTFVSSPLQFGGEPSPIERPAAAAGQHTEEVLLEYGYSWDEINALRDKRAVL